MAHDHPPIFTRPAAGPSTAQVTALAIRNLELVGFRAEHRHAIAQACEQEIERLLSANRFVASEHLAMLNQLSPQILVDPQSSPAKIGQALAESLVNSLRQGSLR